MPALLPALLLLTYLLPACSGEAPCIELDAGEDAAPTEVDAGPPEVASLSGWVSRSATPQAGGVGNLYIALFAMSPVAYPGLPPIGMARVEAVDMRAADVMIPYWIDGIPARAEDYYLTAFLDDNGNAGAERPTPDTGDLIAFEGLGTPQVLLDRGGAFERDLDLNLPYPR